MHLDLEKKKQSQKRVMALAKAILRSESRTAPPNGKTVKYRLPWRPL